MEERPKAPSIVSTSLPACADHIWRFSHRDPAPCGAGQGRVTRLRTFDGAERDSLTDSLGHALVCAPLWNLLPAGFPRELSIPPEAKPLFRAHHRPRQRCGGLLRASSPSFGLPCGLPRSTSTMIATDFCFPLLRLRAPALRLLPVSLRDLRLALGKRPAPATKRPMDLAFHDARSASARSMGLPSAFLPSDPDRSVPLTPLSLLPLRLRAFAEAFLKQVAEAASSPFREDRTSPRPKVPSIG